MDAILDHLTAPQREAVTHVDGPLLILAGPGSGKTRVVTHRIAYLLRQGIAPWQIAALTFTNKAAEEMCARVERLAPGQAVWMGTFHRFCARLLRRYGSMVGLQENYSIYDTTDSKQALKRAIATAEVSTSHTSPEQIAAFISRAKNRLVTPQMLEGQSLRHNEQVAARVYPVYQQQLLTANAVDFDDLLLHVARLLQENPELRGELDARYRYLLVDEYQDTNLAQYAIVRALAVDHPNLAVTGDPDQSIYGWRGADIKNILDFEKDYPHVRTVRLEQNYRSTPNILRAADELIRHNRHRKAKALFTDAPEGEPVVLRMYEDGYQEADDIADSIALAVEQEGYRPSDFAVFCRINALTRNLEHAFRGRGIPYQIVGGVEFYQRKEIKDLLAYLHLINNPAHDVALLRVINTPARGIGARTIERLRREADVCGVPLLEAARRAGTIEGIAARTATKVAAFVAMYDRLCIKATAPLEDLLLFLLEQTKYRDYLERSMTEPQANNPLANVDELLTAAVEFDQQHPEGAALEAFLEQVALVSDTDAWEETQDRVTVMTLHAAKGLEFPCVFIIAVEDDFLPHFRSQEDPLQLEEERRLLFVGITRAQQRLQLSCVQRRQFRGEYRPAVPSPFLMELPRGEMRILDAAPAFTEDDGSDYPDSWDLPTEEDAVDVGYDDEGEVAVIKFPGSREAAGSAAPGRRGGTLASPEGVTTAAELLARQEGGGRLPPAAFRTGMIVTHPSYGSGRIVALSGIGVKRTATIEFFSGDESSFRLAFVDLTIEAEE